MFTIEESPRKQLKIHEVIVALTKLSFLKAVFDMEQREIENCMR